MPPAAVQRHATFDVTSDVTDLPTATVPSALTPTAPPLLFNGAPGSAPSSETPVCAKAISGNAIAAADASKTVRPNLFMCDYSCFFRARLPKIEHVSMSPHADCLSPVRGIPIGDI